MYPCTCSAVSVEYPSGGCPSGNCLRIGSAIITAVLPCGVNETFDILAISDVDICETTILWALLSYDTAAFSSASINSSGVLSFTTTSAATPRSYYTFTGVATCSGTTISQYFTIKVPIEDICYGHVCADVDTICSPCSGVCVDITDVELF